LNNVRIAYEKFSLKLSLNYVKTKATKQNNGFLLFCYEGWLQLFCPEKSLKFEATKRTEKKLFPLILILPFCPRGFC
jgi:hypothetical protein